MEELVSLVLSAQNGDAEAFGRLVGRFKDMAYGYAYAILGDFHLAEDAAQEAFIRGWLHLPSFHEQSSLRNWLYQIAVNAALDMLRKEKKLSTDALDDLPLASHDPDPETAVIQVERKTQVQRAILSLPPSSRAVLVLREYEGLSYQEISGALEIPIGTVMSRLNFARSRLKEILAPQFLSMEVENV